MRGNLVISIAPAEVAGPVPPDDPLEVSTLLARNNLATGSLDGSYDFGNPENARHFAALCAGYMKNLSDKTLEGLGDCPDLESQGWRNPLIPGS